MGDMPCLRKLFIMRHAERVDFTFGGSWISACFDQQGNYIRKNLNMPVSVPKRSSGPQDFLKDCPLTRIGLHQATLTGEAMKHAGITFSHVFCSPSLRCVETCTNALKASDQSHLPINIEPGLFEGLFWYRDGKPKWMTLTELQRHGFNISMEYKPVINVIDILNMDESSEEYYMRNYLATSKIVEKYPVGNLLFVAHAASLDTCCRQLTGKLPRNEKDLMVIVPKISYASIAVMDQNADNSWHITEPPFPPLTHTTNLSFDWKILLN